MSERTLYAIKLEREIATIKVEREIKVLKSLQNKQRFEDAEREIARLKKNRKVRFQEADTVYRYDVSHESLRCGSSETKTKVDWQSILSTFEYIDELVREINVFLRHLRAELYEFDKFSLVSGKNWKGIRAMLDKVTELEITHENLRALCV